MAHHHLCPKCQIAKVPCEGVWYTDYRVSPIRTRCREHDDWQLPPLCVGCRARMAADLEAQEREETPWAV